eukprot:15457979-Alexandrium_andersonii.AAC.1
MASNGANGFRKGAAPGPRAWTLEAARGSELKPPLRRRRRRRHSQRPNSPARCSARGHLWDAGIPRLPRPTSRPCSH